MMKDLKINDRVKFAGNADNSAIDETVIAFIDAKANHAIIECNEGHLGSEFTNYKLAPNKTYISVAANQLELIAPAETIETVTAVKVDETTGETTVEPLSKVLSILKASRPVSDAALMDTFIERAAKLELKNTEKQTKETAVDTEKKIEAANAEAHKTEIANNVVMHDQLNNDVIERQKQDAKEREKILNLVNIGIEKGLLKFYQNGDVILNDNKTFTCAVTPMALETFKTAPTESLCNYFQNTPGDFIEFSAAVASLLTAPVAEGTTEPTAETEVPQTNAPANTDDYKKSVQAKNEAVKAGKKVKSASTTEKPATSLTAEATKVDSKNNTAYADMVLAVNGIGPKYAAKIVADYPTKEKLETALVDKSLTYTPRINELLKTLAKSKAFKAL